MARVLAVLSAATMVFSLAACSGSRHESTEKFYLVAANIKVAYWQSADAGLSRAARGLGVLAEMVGPDTYDPQGEAQQFRNVAAKKPAGILVSVADANVMKDAIDSAIAQGIPVITIDSDAPQSKRLTFIGTNNYQAGLMGGRVLAERLRGKGSVVIFTMPGQPNLDERLQGYKNILTDHPQIKIDQIVNVKGDPRIAFDTTTELIKGKSTPDAYVCLESISCQEVAEVISRHKVEGKVIIAMDTDTETLSWIQKDVIAATIAQKPFTMAHYGVMMLDSLYHFKLPTLDHNWALDPFSPVPAFVDTGAALVDKSNVDAFLKAQPSAGS